MPSVSGSDGNYSYFQKQISDIADDNAAERKKLKERENERIASLERKHAQELREQEDDHYRAIERAKESSNQTLKAERETSKQEYDRLKRDTYNRFGRVNHDQGAEYRTQLEELQRNVEEEKRRGDENLQKAEQTYSSRLADRDQAANIEAQRAVERTRDDLNETHESSMATVKDHETRASREAAERYIELDKSRLEDMEQQRRRYDGALSEANKDYARRVDLAKNAYEKTTARQEQSLRDAHYDEANTLRQAHEQETRELRAKMSALVDAEKDYVKEGAQGKAQAVSEYENEWRQKMETQEASHHRQVADLQAQTDRVESHLAEQNNNNLREKETFLARTLQKQNQTHHNQNRELMDSFMHDRAQMEFNANKDRELQQHLFEERMADANRDSTRGLENQARLLSGNAQEQHKADEIQMQKLQAALTAHETSADTSLVSPAAETALRKQISEQYQKVSDADQDRRLRENELIRGEYKDQLRTERDEYAFRESKGSRAVAAERDGDRNRFNSHIADLEYQKESTLRQRDNDSNRERENLMKNYSRVLDRQSRQTDESMNSVKSESAARIASLREEYEFKSKMAQRDHSIKLNETIHDYDKKLQDQKNEYEARIEDLKTENISQNREAERKLKNTLDQQQRAYEQKLTQQEAQHQERERYITQNFQDELEKVKRSNALLVQKRG